MSLATAPDIAAFTDHGLLIADRDADNEPAAFLVGLASPQLVPQVRPRYEPIPPLDVRPHDIEVARRGHPYGFDAAQISIGRD